METLTRKNFLRLMGISSLGVMASGAKASVFSDLTDLGAGLLPAAPLRVAHLTDIHIQSGLDAEKGFAACLNAVNALAEKPDLIINGGDAIMNSALTFSKAKLNEQWSLFHSILKNDNSIPLAHCIGNHDLNGWPFAKCSEEESKHRAMEEYSLAKPYYAFRRGKWKFIVLDSIQCKNSIPGYYARLDEQQMSWLKDELHHTPAGVFICIVSHVPILAICTLFDSIFKCNKDRKIPNNILHDDAAELTSLFYSYPNIKACLSGHIHLVDHVNYLGVDYYCNGAVSGSWWKGSYHQFPPAFSIMNFHDNGKVTRDLHYYNWNQAAQVSVTRN